MTIRVRSYPHLDDIQPLPFNGISNVVKNYFKHLPKYGIELVPVGEDDNIDIVAIHAGAIRALPATIPIVAHSHGLYWTEDHPNMGIWTDEMNQAVIHVARHASLVTVPSNWVAEVFKRDMHLSPAVIPHGVDWDEWQEPQNNGGYVLWGKNRPSDACDPMPVNMLAARAPKTLFLTTHAAPNPRPNIRVTGTVDFVTMKKMILGANIYLSSTKETFGIQIIEAMAAGVPILGFDYGGNSDLVDHGYSGYLAEPGNYDDLLQGLNYCLEHRDALGANARKAARYYTWDRAAEMVAHAYEAVVERAENEDRPIRIDPELYRRVNA